MLQPKIVKRDLYANTGVMSLYKASYLLRFRGQLFRALYGMDNRITLYFADKDGVMKGNTLSPWEGWSQEQMVCWMNDNVG